MKNIYWYSLFVLNISIYISQSVCAQTVRLSQFQPEAVNKILERQQLHQLLTLEDSKLINSLQKSIIDSEKYELLLDVKELLDKYIVESPIDSQFTRENYKFLGYRIKKFLQDIDTAIDCYEVAHQYGGDLSGVTDVWFVENVMGALYNRKGDHEQALYYYGLTRKRLKEIINESIDPEEQLKFQKLYARLYNNIGYLHFWNQDYNKAESTLLTGLASAHECNSIEAIVFADQLLAELYMVTDRHLEARHYINETERLLTKLPEDKIIKATSVFFGQSGKLAEHDELPDEAIKNYTSALDWLNKSPGNKKTREHAKIFVRTSQVHMTKNELGKARQMIDMGFEALLTNIQDALKGYVANDTENSNAELFESLGQYYLKKFEAIHQLQYLDSAYLAYYRASEVYDEIRTTYLMQGSKLLNIADHRKMINQLIHILWLQQKEDTTNYHISRQADDLFLEANNLLLAEIQEERKAIERLDENKKKQIKVYRDSLGQWSRMFRQEDNSDSKTVCLGKILETKNQIQSIIQSEVPLHTSFDHPNIKFFFGSQYVYATDNLMGETRFQRLVPRSAIEKLVYVSIDGIQNKDESAHFYNNQHELYTELISPMMPLPDRFTIYPDNILYYLSFQALISDTLSRRYLVQDYMVDIGYLGSENSGNKSASSSHLMTIAPEYDYMSGKETIGFLYLPFAQEEAKAISRVWPGTSHQLKKVSRENVISAIKTSDVIHYAGHALVDGDDSYLVLNNDTSSWVHHDDIASISSDAHTVILSACETGRGILERGEGVRSMAKSFLYSGVDQVVYSLWAISDQFTKDIMTSLYNNLKDINQLTSALALAQRDHLENANPGYHHPYYWAAFQSSHIDRALKKSWPRGLLFLLGLPLIIIFYLLIKSKLK